MLQLRLSRDRGRPARTDWTLPQFPRLENQPPWLLTIYPGLDKKAGGTPAVPGTGIVWAPDYFDRYIRNRVHFGDAVFYLENNPVKAGLVKRPHEWPFSSAAYNAGEDARGPRIELL